MIKCGKYYIRKGLHKEKTSQKSDYTEMRLDEEKTIREMSYIEKEV